MCAKTSLATWAVLFYRSCVGKSEAAKVQDGRGLTWGGFRLLSGSLGPNLFPGSALWLWSAVFCLAGLVLGCDGYSDLRASLGPADQARFARGQREATACWTCHDLTGSALKVGPPLGGVMGRRVGGVTDFPYSEALRASNRVWTEDTLDAFLASPQEFLPGNRMISPALGDFQRRRDLIFFLSQVWGQEAGKKASRP